MPPVPAIPKQFSGSGPQRTQSPLSRQQYPSTQSPETAAGSDWLISPQEKAQFDSVFATVDKSKTGYINGDQAVGFFTNAQLPEETLAQIWDLADIDSDGQLSKDEFAVAMYLVRQQRIAGETLPQTLPPALTPPSMRQPQPQPQQQQQPSEQKSASDDLFGLDVFSSAAPPQVQQSTGGSNQSPQAPASPTQRPAPSTTFKPFIPASSFGQSIATQDGGSTAQGQQTQAQPAPKSADDLLGDADPEESKKLTQDTSDLANLSNQIGTLSKEMESVQGKRAGTEQDLTQTSQQKQDFEARLAQARTIYEQEVKDFKVLEERLTASRAETKKLEQEYSMIEANRQDLQNQHNQASAALESDQRENAKLKEKISQANAQISQLKPQVEKMRSDGRQQKGLVAINKKQLATVEGERDRLQEGAGTPDKEIPELEQQTTGSSSGPAPVTSPPASTASQGTNPFFKRTQTSSSGNALSPPPATDEGPKDAQNVFDNMFGPADHSATSAPPPTTFRTESPQQTEEAPSKTPTPPPSLPATTFTPSSEPPPPPESRQITPSELPITSHQSSGPSSVKPSPPTSRFGGATEPEATNRSEGSKTRSSSEDETPADEAASAGQVPKDDDHSDGEPSVPGAFPSESRPEKDVSFEEAFGGRVHQRSKSQKAQDFDETFAAMKPKPEGLQKDASKTNGATTDAGTGEFPPIREFDNDEDDSSSDDDDDDSGFDDDFTPTASRKPTASPQQGTKESEAFPFPSSEKTDNASAPPPGANSQAAPPPYTGDNAPEEEPRGNTSGEFKGLLPGRNDPTSPGDAPHSVESSTGDPIVHGVPQHATGSSSTSATGPKKPDFEAAFAGLDLAPAKEEDDDDEDSSEDDHFESPFENKDPSHFDMSFEQPHAPTAPKTGSKSENNNNNNLNFNLPPSEGQGESTSLPQSNPPSSHDWDALFSVLDGSKSGGNEDDTQTPQPQTSSEQAGQPGVSAQSFPQPPIQGKQPGWALSVDSGGDDQTLQRLTAMGYARDESLAALEKFDYQIDKVRSDFLSRSS